MGSSSFGMSRQRSNSQNTAESGTTSRIAGEQLPFLTDLWGQASRLASDQADIGINAGELAGNLYGAGANNLGMFQNMAAGTDPLQQEMLTRASSGNPRLQEMIDLLGTDINRNLGLQLQSINEQAGGLGVRGGDRANLALGTAAQGATEEFMRGASNLRYGDYQTQNQLLSDVMGQRQGAGQFLQGSLAGMYDLGMAPYQAQWQPLMSLASIIGGPAMIQDAWSRSQGSSASRGDSFNTSLAFSGGGG